eukprot:gene18811-22508_t
MRYGVAEKVATKSFTLRVYRAITIHWTASSGNVHVVDIPTNHYLVHLAFVVHPSILHILWPHSAAMVFVIVVDIDVEGCAIQVDVYHVQTNVGRKEDVVILPVDNVTLQTLHVIPVKLHVPL